jgi:hypothetical protein
VFVHRLVAEGTIEARIEELEARKQALAAWILDGAEGGAPGMTEADLELLFAAWEERPGGDQAIPVMRQRASHGGPPPARLSGKAVGLSSSAGFPISRP